MSHLVCPPRVTGPLTAESTHQRLPQPPLATHMSTAWSTRRTTPALAMTVRRMPRPLRSSPDGVVKLSSVRQMTETQPWAVRASPDTPDSTRLRPTLAFSYSACSMVESTMERSCIARTPSNLLPSVIQRMRRIMTARTRRTLGMASSSSKAGWERRQPSPALATTGLPALRHLRTRTTTMYSSACQTRCKPASESLTADCITTPTRPSRSR